jgi:hypothetical protein
MGSSGGSIDRIQVLQLAEALVAELGETFADG